MDSLNRRKFLKHTAFAVTTGTLAGTSQPVVKALKSNRDAQKDDDFQDWGVIRSHFLLSPNHIHLAGMLLASHPAPVRQALEKHRQGLDENPVNYMFKHKKQLEDAVYKAAANYLKTAPEQIALTDSTTMGLGLVYNGLVLQEGQEILTTEHDHYSTHESLRFAASKSNNPLKKILLYDSPETASEKEIINNLKRAITPKTRVVAVTWVHSGTGVKLPIPAMSQVIAQVNANRALGERALFCVDGVHGFGIEDFVVDDLGCDFFIAGCHKWLFGPRGTGIIWGSPQGWQGVLPTIPPFSRQPYSAWLKNEIPENVPPGLMMTPGGFHSFEHRWAVAQAFEYHQQIGKTRVANRIHNLNRYCKEGLKSIKKVQLRTPLSEKLSSGIICFEIDGLAPQEVVKRLREKNIFISQSPYAKSYVRITPSLFNSYEDIDQVLMELLKLTA